MLGGFSWGQFLGCWLALALSWYLVVLLVYYRRELKALLGGRPMVAVQSGSGVGLAARSRAFVKTEVLDGESAGDVVVGEELMGRSALPQGMSVVDAGSLVFVGDGGGAGEARYDQVGLVADVLEELKGIFATLEREAGDKAMFFRLIGELGERYGRIGGHPNIGAINAFVSEHAPFHLSSEELEGLWS